MCGIAGLIDKQHLVVPSYLINEMANTMVKRGPDGKGDYFSDYIGMTMRRLSVIDLKGGWQPLYSNDQQIVAFQNGEIYNFKELRNQLEKFSYHFKTYSDTEVLAHGYNHWGIDELLQKIDGMFAIAIYDDLKKELHLARDRYGEKPLFYSYGKDFFAYSSNTTALNILPHVNNEININGLNYYLALHFVPGEQTIFKDIYRLLPGERLVVDTMSMTIKKRKYYNVTRNLKPEYNEDELTDFLMSSVKSRLISDVPIGVFLSGGLDSSIVASIAANNQNSIDTFSMGFHSQKHDESKYALMVSKDIQSRHHHFVFDENSFVDLLPKVVKSLDEPIGDQAMLPLYWLCQEAKKYVTVVLSGEGADEIFSGYEYYYPFVNPNSKFSDNEYVRKNLESLINNSENITPSGFPIISNVFEREELLGISLQSNCLFGKDVFNKLHKTNNSLQRASLADIFTWLPDDLLVKFDRMTMAHSLEGRAPYLKKEIVEFGLSIPPDLKFKNGKSKFILAEKCGHFIPEEILSRKKQGFVLPMSRWIKQWFDGFGVVKEYFIQKSVPYVNKDVIIEIINNDLTNGIKRERLLFAIIILFEWYDSYFEKLKILRKQSNIGNLIKLRN